MTAEKQHLHEKLGISFAELGALLGFRNMLAAGLVTHTPSRYGATLNAQDGCHVFNMNHSGKVYGCGSVGCIAGGMAMIMGVQNPEYYTAQFGSGGSRRDDKISHLFFPHGVGDWGDNPTSGCSKGNRQLPQLRRPKVGYHRFGLIEKCRNPCIYCRGHAMGGSLASDEGKPMEREQWKRANS